MSEKRETSTPNPPRFPRSALPGSCLGLKKSATRSEVVVVGSFGINDNPKSFSQLSSNVDMCSSLSLPHMTPENYRFAILCDSKPAGNRGNKKNYNVGGEASIGS